MPKSIPSLYSRFFSEFAVGEIVFLLWFGLFCIFCSPAHAASLPLQNLVDQADAGAVIHVPPGEYTGPVRINKSLTLIAENAALLSGADDEPVVRLEANGVRLKGFRIVDNRTAAEEGAVVVTGSENVLEDLSILTEHAGIELRDAHRNRMRGIAITNPKAAGEDDQDKAGKQGAVRTWKGNGFDLLGSHDNIIEFNRISHMMDAIYVERSESNRINNNIISDSRYGIHLMFTHDTEVMNNAAYRNVTGLMVMGTEDTKILYNRFERQSENVNSQGILLFDAKRTLVQHNRVEGNRVGIYMELSSENTLSMNYLSRNFIGFQGVQSEQNTFTRNYLVANVIQGQARDMKNNEISGNFWDDAQWIDLNGDGISELGYSVSPFFQIITDEKPPFQLFFHSPGTLILQDLFYSPPSERMTDPSPLIQPAFLVNDMGGGEKETVADAFALAASIFMFLMSFTIMYQGVRTK